MSGGSQSIKLKYRVSLEIDDRHSSVDRLMFHNRFIEKIMSRSGYDKNYCLRSNINKYG